MLIILAGLLVYVGTANNRMAVDSAVSLAETSAEKVAVSVQKELELAMNAARTLADSFAGMKSSGMADRETVHAMLKKVLESNASYLGTWTVWEPNAFDGLDSNYTNTEASDGTGRLVPYYSRSGSAISLSAITGYDKPGEGDFYLLARNNGNETVLNPYKYAIAGKEVLMTTLAVPIRYDNKIVGVAGVDIALDQLQTMMEKITLYSTGYASIYSNDGSAVTSPKQEQIGKKLVDISRDEAVSVISRSIKEGTMYTSKENGTYQQFMPIQIGTAKAPWSVAVAIPMKEITEKSDRLLMTTIFAGMITLLIMGAVVVWLTNTIVKPIEASVAIGVTISEGDFTKDIPPQYLMRKDEIGRLAQVFEDITKKLREMIGHVQSSAMQVAAAAQQISASTEEIAGGSTNQANAAQSMHELFGELSTAINAVARSAEQAASLSSDALDIAKDGGKVVSGSIDKMKLVQERMARLEDDSNKIGDIIDVIDDIAEQTNLLALNAAIEAARAGEQGRGFAVVADEVRKLADRSRDATRQITEIIQVMQDNTRRSVEAVEEGVASSQKTEEAFDRIVNMVNHSAGKVTEIAAASEEQAAQSSEVLLSIATISASTEEAAAGSEETAATAQSLAQLAEELSYSAAQFKIK